MISGTGRYLGSAAQPEIVSKCHQRPLAALSGQISSLILVYSERCSPAGPPPRNCQPLPISPASAGPFELHLLEIDLGDPVAEIEATEDFRDLDVIR